MDSANAATAKPTAPRMRFWPRDRRASLALISLFIFVALQSLLMASTIPPFWAPDEDYHWGYVNHLSERGTLADPSEPFYSKEWNEAIVAMNFNQFGMAPAKVSALKGDPHAATKELDRLPASAREPNGEPTRPVVHAPLYHAVTAALIKPFAGESIFTKLWMARAVNALTAMLIVFAAWLLAAQVFSREGPRLFVAGLTAVQPMLAYATGSMTNDAMLIAWFTMTIAVLCFMIGNPPDRAQGRLVGIFAGLALLSKTSALALGPLVLIAFALQWKRSPDGRSELYRSFGWAAGLSFAIAGWFFAYLILKYHTLLGNVGALNGTPPGEPLSLLNLPIQTIEWLKLTYATYWSHFVYWEGARYSIVFYVPMLLGSAAIAGFAVWFWRNLRSSGPRSQYFNRAIFLAIAVIVMMLPFIGVDLMRKMSGNSFMVNGGRFLLPAYPAACVLFVLGVRELLRPRSQRWAFPLLVLVAAWQGLWMWKIKTLDRYFGGTGVTSVKQELERASFFRPEWITQETLALLIAAMVLSGACAWWMGVRTTDGSAARSPARSGGGRQRAAARRSA